MNPFKYRPSNPEEGDDWEDNHASNFLAWASEKFTPNYCKTIDHWSSTISNYFWTDCPCCLFFRGVIVGALATFLPVALLAAAMYVF